MVLPELRPRLPLLPVALAAALGIVLADGSAIAPAGPVWIAGGFLAALLIWPRTAVAWACTVAAFFALHTLNFHESEGRLLLRAVGSGPVVAEATGVVWNEPAKPKIWARNVTGHFSMRLERLQAGGAEYETSAPVEVRWDGAELPKYGDRVSVLGSLRELAPVRNDGQFDAVTYRHRQGVYFELAARYPADCVVLSGGHGEPLLRVAFAARRWICHVLEVDLQDAPEISSLIESMLLGVRGETPEETRDLFQETGTMHLFAVSGFNVMMLATLAWLVCKTLRIKRTVAILLIIPLLFAYALVIGAGASSVRAAITSAVVLGGYLLDRKPPAVNSVAAAACAILAWDTNQLFSTGFQFTFVLVLVLIGLVSPLEQLVLPWGLPDPYLPKALWDRRQRCGVWCWQKVTAAFCLSLAGWAGSLVFSVTYFHIMSPISILTNVVAVPLALVIFYLGAGAVTAGLFSTALAGLFNNANWLCTEALLHWLTATASLPAAYAYVQPRFHARPACEFTVLDLGAAAGAVHLRAPGADWLIDCGHGYAYEQMVVPYLRSQGVTRLDGFILTHGDAPHMGSALALLGDFRPRLVLDNPLKDRSKTRREFESSLAEGGRSKRIVWRGDTVDIAPSVRLMVLYPPAGLQRSLADDKALVVRLEAAGSRALFVSDAGFSTEQWLLQNEPDLHAEVLVKGQHAKDPSGSEDFLHAVHPALIISENPRLTATPEEHDAWAKSVGDEGIALFPQEKTGAVHVTLEPGRFEATGYVDGSTFRSRAR